MILNVGPSHFASDLFLPILFSREKKIQVIQQNIYWGSKQWLELEILFKEWGKMSALKKISV